MITEDNVGTLKWLILIADVCILYFLHSRMMGVAETLFSSSFDTKLAYSVTYGHLFSIPIVIFISVLLAGGFVFYLLKKRGMEPDPFMSRLAYFFACVVILAEIALIMGSIANVDSDPYTATDPSLLEYFADITISLLLVGFHIFCAYITADWAIYWYKSLSNKPLEYSLPPQSPKDELEED